jgi:peptidoglycan/LPS O-acetylase OafA/YrhL
LNAESTTEEIAAPEKAPHPEVRQLDALTSLRFFAAMLVLAFHYATVHFGDAPVTGLPSLGYTGVTFFFMLSGFILSYNYHKVDFSSRQNLHRYFLARAARIYPVYLASLLIALPFFCIALIRIPFPGLQLLFGSSAILAPLGLQSWLPGAACALNCPSWSISTEFFFYLVFPFVFPLIYARPGLWIWISLITWITSLVVCWLVWLRFGYGLSIMGDLRSHPAADIASQFVKYFPVVRVSEFLLGILLFVVWERHRSRLSKGALLAAFVIACIGLGVARNEVSEIAFHDGLTAIAWAPLILLGASLRQGLLVWPVMQFLGRISFCLYLTHEPVFSLMHWVDKHLLGGLALSISPWCFTIPTTIVAIGVSALLYSIVEKPARRLIMDRRRIAPAMDPLPHSPV